MVKKLNAISTTILPKQFASFKFLKINNPQRQAFTIGGYSKFKFYDYNRRCSGTWIVR